MGPLEGAPIKPTQFHRSAQGCLGACPEGGGAPLPGPGHPPAGGGGGGGGGGLEAKTGVLLAHVLRGSEARLQGICVPSGGLWTVGVSL